MKNRCASILGLLVLLVASGNAIAQPALSLSELGLNADGNREWAFEVTPDAALFVDTADGFGAVIALEVGAEITGASLLDVAFDSLDWSFENVGYNPFTEGMSVGVAAESETVFASLGTEVITTADPLRLILETTPETPATVSWGGYAIFPGTSGASTGARISQTGMNFDGLSGMLTVDGGGGCTTSSDFDVDGDVDTADRTILTQNWTGALGVGVGTSTQAQGDADCDFDVDSADITVLVQEWTGAQGATLASEVSVVPEPNGAMLALVSAVILPFVLRASRSYRALSES